jgi:hypothetical protein
MEEAYGEKKTNNWEVSKHWRQPFFVSIIRSFIDSRGWTSNLVIINQYGKDSGFSFALEKIVVLISYKHKLIS